MKITSSVPFHKDNLTRLLDWLGWNPTSRLEIVVEQDRTGTRRAASGRAFGSARRIYLRVPKKFETSSAAPRLVTSGGFRGYLKYTAHTLIEDFVYTLAHELRHLDQYRQGTYKARDPQVRQIRRKALGTRADLTEVDASRYGIQKMRAFRREFPSDFKLTV